MPAHPRQSDHGRGGRHEGRLPSGQHQVLLVQGNVARDVCFLIQVPRQALHSTYSGVLDLVTWSLQVLDADPAMKLKLNPFASEAPF
jgi:hypothetical protein